MLARGTVLGGGDLGDDNSGRTTFVDTVKIALEYGWRVELWSWKTSLNRAYKDLARQHPCTHTTTKTLRMMTISLLPRTMQAASHRRRWMTRGP